MLEGIPARHHRRTVYRFARLPADEFLNSLGVGARGERELRELLQEVGYMPPSPGELCDAPFRRKARLTWVTRFSDGSYPVFYAALEPETPEAEVTHWFRTFAGTPRGPRTAYYERFSCTFDGMVKDLRPKTAEWPALTDEDYAFCNRLGAEAIRASLDGLVTPSARRRGGTNLPVFKRRAISDPESQGVTQITYDPER